MSSASAADGTHWRANRSNPGASLQKQFLQFSWLATGSMTFSRSLYPKRCRVQVLSASAQFFVKQAILPASLQGAAVSRPPQDDPGDGESVLPQQRALVYSC